MRGMHALLTWKFDYIVARIGAFKHTRLGTFARNVGEHAVSMDLDTRSALPLRSLNHISLLCKDLDRSVRFYRDVLGFYEIKRPEAFKFDGSWLFNHGIGIHLIQGHPVSRPEAINPRADHLSFQSDNVEEVKAVLRNSNLPYVTRTIKEAGQTVAQVFFHDPDNNMIEICNCDCLPVVPLMNTVQRSYSSCKSMMDGCHGDPFVEISGIPED